MGSCFQHIVLPEQYALIYYRKPCNHVLMPIVRKTRLSDNMRTNLRGRIRELFVIYYSIRVIRFSSKSLIWNQYTVIAWNININYEQRNINSTTLLLLLGHIPIIVNYHRPFSPFKGIEAISWRHIPSCLGNVLQGICNRHAYDKITMMACQVPWPQFSGPSPGHWKAILQSHA
jgi:hypothetical protein